MPSISQIVHRPVASLLPAERNPNTHTRKQIRKIADAIERFGFVSPILLGGEPSRIVAGHGRWAAAKLLGLKDVPTIVVDGLAPAELRALALADNQLKNLSKFDRDLLAIELAEIELLAPELDLTVTGFEIEQIEFLHDAAATKKAKHTRDTIPPIPTGRPTTRLGDLWHIGEHRLLCGSAIAAADYATLMETSVAELVITDPPYNVPIAGHVSSQGFDEFCMASGELTRQQFQLFLSDVCRLLVRFSRSGSLHFIFMDWRSIADLVGAGEEHYAQLLNIVAWVKPVGGMGSLYRSRHELVALFKNGSRPHTNNIELGANGRNRTNVWEYPGVNGFGDDRKLGALHPTVKNVDMIADAIRDASRTSELVLDPFGGSGTTLVAAHRTRRRARLIELDPRYCDLCIHRALEEGLIVELAATGETYAHVEARRLNEATPGDSA